MANKNLTVGNVVAFIGRSLGGKPNTALRFGTPSEAEAVLVEGELLDAVRAAFDPSPETNAPQSVVAVRVNPAEQASLTLLDASSNPVITLKSTDYGLRNNQIKVKVETGSTAGKKLTTQFGNDYYTADNVARNAFGVQYSGAAATATMSITGTSIVLQAPSGTTIDTIELATFKTVQQVVDRINSLTGFAASVKDGNNNKLALNGLDYVTSQDVKTAEFVVTANLQAIIDWFNSSGEGFVTATRGATAGAVPGNVGFTYLSGGSDGIVTNAEWADAYETLQTVDVQWVTPISPEPSIWAMNDAHVSFMSNNKKERRAIVGTNLGTSNEDAISAAKSLNSDRTSLVHIGHYSYDPQGNLVLRPAYLTAALIAGAFAGVNPGTPMTNKALKVVALERDLRNPTETDVLINGGVLCVENTDTGYKVVQSISTWLINSNYNRREVSTGVAVDFTARNWRQAVDSLRGSKSNPLLISQAISRSDSVLRELSRPEPQGVGVLAGDEANPPYKNIQASIEGDVLRLQAQVSPVIPNNYILITIAAVPWSGSASA
ncbi:phage tail sheath subtilisin-like domain-containing protein [Geminicoccus harenae]|uniref:phage tail sheath subtilisin-like domain-containing protein n=1 Tax=Geminicoccus harenae TaxID=2498453 RepID=UPI00168B71B4|nr:phage tail sheath subtilisin-like domain-containing protein [Geminicoccus harenae]